LAALWPAIAGEFPREPIAGAEGGTAVEPLPGTTPVGLPPGTTADGIGASRSVRLARLAPDWRLPEVPAGPDSRGIAVAAYDSSEEEIPALQPQLAPHRRSAVS
ncbi:MAG: hypothetical protein WBE92_11675, partial [Steroidobacteraceae bacterium]